MIAGFSGAKLDNFTASGLLGMAGFLHSHGPDQGFVGVVLGPKKDAERVDGFQSPAITTAPARGHE